MASFGGRAAYIGRVRDDQLGAVFAHDLRAAGVTFRCPPATDGPPTGRCLIVVTPDAQRTMSTYLGASEFLGPEDVDGDLIAAAQITYLEGYLFDRPESQEAYWKASRVAHEAERRVSLTLSDTFCVERHQEAWRSLVTDQVDVLFANEGEAMALYDVSTLDEVIRHVQADVEIGAITCGPQGSLVVHHGRGDRRSPPTRCPRSSTRPEPATCTPPGSSTGSPTVVRSRPAVGWARWRRRPCSGTPGPARGSRWPRPRRRSTSRFPWAVSPPARRSRTRA